MAKILSFTPKKGEFDFNQIVSKGSVATSPTIGVYTTLLSIAGEGLLYEAIVAAFNLYWRTIKITVDGVVVFWGEGAGTGNGNSAAIGIISKSHVLAVPIATDVTVPGAVCGIVDAVFARVDDNALFPLATHQTGLSSSGKSASIPRAIKFEKSLLIEIASFNTASVSTQYSIIYAI